MTYGELLLFLQALTDEQLSMDVTVFLPSDVGDGECYPVFAFRDQNPFPTQFPGGTLDDDHPYLELRI